MVDEKIISMFSFRPELAVAELSGKYGRFCRKIAYNILRNREDGEKCMCDAFLWAWRSKLQNGAGNLFVTLARVTRDRALERYGHYSGDGRRRCEIDGVLRELGQCVFGEGEDNSVLSSRLDVFLDFLEDDDRNLFVGRYWFLYSVDELCRMFDMEKIAVEESLLRSREKLQRISGGETGDSRGAWRILCAMSYTDGGHLVAFEKDKRREDRAVRKAKKGLAAASCILLAILSVLFVISLCGQFALLG